MPWYNDNKNEWKEIIQTIANEEMKTEQMIEKDTIQSYFLHELSKSNIPLIFKGGMSLSKAYRIIDRFSEDIDLSAARKLTESEKRMVRDAIIEIANKLGLILFNPDDIMSRYNYNKYIFKYVSLFIDCPLEIIIETNFYHPVYPIEIHNIDSFIGIFCKKHNIILPVHFDPIITKMPVQSLERTFIDKVFAVCDYRIQNMQNKNSRHLYDIAKILPNIEITSQFKRLILDIRNDRMKSKNNPSAQPQHNISDILNEIVESNFYETDYNTITQRLLYNNMSYEEAIKNGIGIIAKMKIF